MTIIVEEPLMRHVDEFIKDIHSKHSSKIKKVYKSTREILFNDGDVLKVVSMNSHTDGMSADVAIGQNAQYFTCRSNQSKRIWDYIDLHNYLDRI